MKIINNNNNNNNNKSLLHSIHIKIALHLLYTN